MQDFWHYLLCKETWNMYFKAIRYFLIYQHWRLSLITSSYPMQMIQ